MKFPSIVSVLSFAALAIASPTVELIEKRQTQAAAASACKQKGGSVLCCDPEATKLSGLLGVIPQLTCVGIIVNPETLCSSNVGCCQNNPTQETNQAVVQILPGAIVCPVVGV